MKKLKAEEIEALLVKFYNLIDEHISPERAKKLKDFYKSIELTLATSPAAPKLAYHNCFPGGYLDHIIRVVQISLVMDRVWDNFDQKKNYTTEELVFSAINHDLGKLGTNENPFYIPNDSDWHVKNQGSYYKVNPKLPHMRVSDRSLFYLQQAGIEVSENEFLAIKLHDGLYEEANKAYYMTFSPEFEIKTNLVHVLHQADFIASRVEN